MVCTSKKYFSGAMQVAWSNGLVWFPQPYSNTAIQPHSRRVLYWSAMYCIVSWYMKHDTCADIWNSRLHLSLISRAVTGPGLYCGCAKSLLRKTWKMSFSLHHPSFRLKNFTPKSAWFLTIPNLRQSRLSHKMQKKIKIL